MKTHSLALSATLGITLGAALFMSGCSSTPPVAEKTSTVYTTTRITGPSEVTKTTTRTVIEPVAERRVILRTVGERPGFIDPYHTGNSYRDRTLFGSPR